MPRPKSVPDTAVHAAIAALYGRGGDKAVTFAAVASATGLAPPTLVQRYGSRDGMLEWALRQGWDQVDAATRAALPILLDKGAAAYLKAVSQASRMSFTLAELVAATRSADLQTRAGDRQAAFATRQRLRSLWASADGPLLARLESADRGPLPS